MSQARADAARSEVATLTLSPRAVLGKKTARLRRDGEVPVHLYGLDKDPLALKTSYGELRRLLPKVGRNIPVAITVEGQEGEDICFVREVQRDPVSYDVIHVDFLRTDVRRRVTADVPVALEGTPPAVSMMGGTLIQNMLTVSVEALPLDMPPAISVDVSILEDFDATIHVSDLPSDDRVTIVSTGGDLVARVAAPRVEVEAGIEADEAMAAEGVAPDGETPAEASETSETEAG